MPAIPEAPAVGAAASLPAAAAWPGGDYAADQRLPASLGAARVPPEVHELSRQLRRHADLAAQFTHLQYIERMIQQPGMRFDSIPQAVLLRAACELRLLARRCDAATGARLLDYFEGRLQAWARQGR